MQKLLSFLSSLLLTSCTVVGIRHSPEPSYQVLLTEGEYQIRAYPPLVLAETVVEADYSEAGSIGFNRLAGYIFGRNAARTQMPMTTPVFREPAGENIGMTAPVFQQAEGKRWTMAFVMPERYQFDTLPVPLDAQVTLKEIPAKKVAVLRYSGALNESAMQAQSQKLLAWLERQSLHPLSKPRSAAYDPPWTFPALRRNEVHVDIE